MALPVFTTVYREACGRDVDGQVALSDPAGTSYVAVSVATTSYDVLRRWVTTSYVAVSIATTSYDVPARPPKLRGMDINGTSAIVTGASSGIGAAVARQLAAKGAKVVVADLNADKGQEVAAEIGGVFAPVDVTKTEQIQAAVEQALELGPLWTLVNSAGIGWAQRTIGRDGEFASAADIDAFRKVIAINLVGSFDAIRLAATAMSRNEPNENGERGAIVNMASVAAFDGQIGQASYSASKGGVVGMTLPVARDLSASGIRVNTVAPGLIDTPIYGEGEQSEQFKAHLGQSVLFPKRLGVPDELASMVIECVTNSYMNAETIRVDGGIRMPPK